ncbi:MAG: cell wall metabolism sensor histidine kinase WalK [Firmicutes bacterium]|nr:cell wall metabolism sensor histidine kinase WalK [Bacillota bacterium]
MKKLKGKSLFSSFSLTFRLSLGFVLLITFMLIAVGISTYIRDKNVFMEEAVNRGWTTVRTVNTFAADHLKDQHYELLNQMVNNLEEDSFVYQVSVTDINGKIVANRDKQLIGEKIGSNAVLEVMESQNKKITTIQGESGKTIAITFTSPITDTTGKTYGYFNLTADLRYVHEHLQQTAYNILLNFVLAAMAGLFLTRLIILKNVHRPVQSLLSITEKISTGDFSQQLPVATQDELGRLAQGFNTMNSHLGTLFQSIKGTVDEMNRTSMLIAKRSESSNVIEEKEKDNQNQQEKMKQINSNAKRLSRLSDKLNSLILQFKTERH